MGQANSKAKKIVGSETIGGHHALPLGKIKELLQKYCRGSFGSCSICPHSPAQEELGGAGHSHPVSSTPAAPGIYHSSSASEPKDFARNQHLIAWTEAWTSEATTSQALSWWVRAAQHRGTTEREFGLLPQTPGNCFALSSAESKFSQQRSRRGNTHLGFNDCVRRYGAPSNDAQSTLRR